MALLLCELRCSIRWKQCISVGNTEGFVCVCGDGGGELYDISIFAVQLDIMGGFGYCKTVPKIFSLNFVLS